MYRIFTNDLERERLRQDAYANTPNRLSLNRHRTRRSSGRNLTIVAIVAQERGDRTLLNECRDALGLDKGQRLDTTFELVQSRRHSRAQRFGFASNRVLNVEVLDAEPQPSFPLVDGASMAAAEHGRLVAHAA